VHDVAEDYMRTTHPDRPYTPPTKYHPLDPEHSRAIAQAYEEMKHTPVTPRSLALDVAFDGRRAKPLSVVEPEMIIFRDIARSHPRICRHTVRHIRGDRLDLQAGLLDRLICAASR